MKTEQILDMDCTKEQNKKKLNNFLFKIKPVINFAKKNNIQVGEYLPLELLELIAHKLMSKYDYNHQGVNSYFENGEFKFYICSCTKKENNVVNWIGNVYGVTMWEIFAKIIVKIYAGVRKEKENAKE